MVTARQELALAKRIGKAIASNRVQRDMTQEALARAIGCEQETVSRFERGFTIPSVARLVDIADIFNVPLEHLLRTGSARNTDISEEILEAVGKLKENDRLWVRDVIKELSQRLPQKSTK